MTAEFLLRLVRVDVGVCADGAHEGCLFRCVSRGGLVGVDVLFFTVDGFVLGILDQLFFG